MNKSDAFVCIFLLISVFYGMRNGVFKSIIKMLSTLISLVASLVLYPMASAYLRTTIIFDSLKNTIIENLGLEQIVVDATRQGERQLIESLPLPESVIEELTINNNSTVYSILGVENIVDYIGGFVANMILNVAVMVLLFVAINILIKLVFKALGLVEKIALMRTVSKAGGGFVGLCTGVLILWMAFLCINMFMSNDMFNSILNDIRMSYIANILYEYNAVEAYFYSKGLL